MLRRLKSFIRSEKGAVLPWMAMMFPLLIGMAGLGVDVSHWMMMKRKLQIAADAAAMAGGFDIANSRSQDYATSAATTQATANGWTTTGGGTIAVTYASDSLGTTVTVNIKQKAYMWFADYFLNGTIYVGTTAASYVKTSNGPYCMLSLDPSAHDAVSVTGTVDVNAAGCGIAVNSSQSDSLYLNGNVFVNVGDVHLAGGDSLVGNSYTFDYTGLQTYASQTTDPYSSLSVPSVSAQVWSNGSNTLTSSTTCTDDQLKSSNANKWTASKSLTPGRYCGGINVSGSGNSIDLAPGVYIMDGGDFNMSGGGTVKCSTCTNPLTNTPNAGVTIILTNTNTSKGSWGGMNISGGGDVQLYASNTDPSGYPGFGGVAIYQDRSCGTACNANVVVGNANVQIEGVAYAPSSSFKFGGTTTTGSQDCTKIIAKTISFNGTPEMGNSCTNSGTKGIGTPEVTLVL